MRGKGASPYDRSELLWASIPIILVILILNIARSNQEYVKRIIVCAPYFLLIFVKPFEWWASKAIGDWKGPDAGYLSAGAYFWAKADKLTWQNIPSNPRPVTFDYISRSKYISNRQIACDLPNSSQIQDNPEWIPSLPFRICQCLRPGWIAK